MNNKNTISASIDDVVRLSENAIEILSKIHDTVSSNSSSVSLVIKDTDGIAKTIQMPTIGYLKSSIDRLERNINTLAGIDGNTSFIHKSDNSYKRIIVSDLNVEPNDILSLKPINTFKQDNNWFFDSLLNPSLSIEFDLTDSIQDGIRKILSRRFIVEFDQNDDGSYTSDAQLRIAEFNTKYNGKYDIDIVEFVSWLSSNGLANRANPLVDEQMFDLSPQRLQYTGYFSVLGQQTDTLNDKLWYIFDSLNYQDVSNVNAAPVTKSLKVGDEVTVVPVVNNSTTSTVYKVIDISTATSDLRVQLERVQGDEPVSTRVASLKIYSPVTANKKVKVTIGFDEYNVIFFKPFNTDANLLAKNWSKGTGYFTSELRLDNTSGQFLRDFYDAEVYDYGAVLKDLVQKKIPNSLGSIPNTPLLYDDNFKVVQINKHLTDTVDAEHIRKLNNDKNNLNAEIEQLRSDLTKQVKLIATKRFISADDRQKALDEQKRISDVINTKNTQLQSTINEILSTKKTNSNVDRKYKLRGFVPFPASINNQEVIQFEFWYRYSSKNGSQPPVESVAVGENNKVSGAISNWVPYISDIRKRTYDKATGLYKWEIENVTDADTPNINQLDISINPGEKIEFKVRAISEVGWPDAKIYSEWSDIKTVEFPDDLSQVVGEDDFILKEATQEEAKVRFEKALDARGLGEHLSDGFQSDGKYYPHNASSIASGFLDSNGKIIDVYQKLTEALNRITALEELVKRAKGELKISIFNLTTEKQINNDSEITLTIELENFLKTAQLGTLNYPITPTNKRTYINELTVYKDIFVRLQNTAQDNPLGLLSSRTYDSAFSQVYQSGVAQAAWVNDNNNIVNNYPTNNKTQFDNQFIWQMIKDKYNNPLFSYGSQLTSTAVSTKMIHDVLVSSAYNVTLKEDASITTLALTDSTYWESNNITGFAATLHGKINNSTSIIETGVEKIKSIKSGELNAFDIPLNLYYKLHTYTTPFNSYAADSASTDLYDHSAVESILQLLMNNIKFENITNDIQAEATFETNGTANYTNGTTTMRLRTTPSGSDINSSFPATVVQGEVVKIDTPILTVSSDTYTIGQILYMAEDANLSRNDARAMVIKVHSATQISVVALTARSFGYFGALLNGQGYTAATCQTEAGTGTGCTITATTVVNGAITEATLLAGGTGYVVGDILHLTQSSSSKVIAGGCKVRVTTVSSGVVTGIQLIKNDTQLIINTTSNSSMPEIMNKYVKVISYNTRTGSSSESITTNFNSTNVTPFIAGGSSSTYIGILTEVVNSTSGIVAPGVELWNSIGRDNLDNKPINKNIIVYNSNNLGTSPILYRSNRYLLETENSSKPFSFGITMNIRQYKDVNVISNFNDSGASNPASLFS